MIRLVTQCMRPFAASQLLLGHFMVSVADMLTMFSTQYAEWIDIYGLDVRLDDNVAHSVNWNSVIVGFDGCFLT